MPTIGETKRCEACGEPLIFAMTRDGKLAPITHNPKDNGNVLLLRSRTGDLHARTFVGTILDGLRGEGVTLRLNHFADCESADRFKR